MEKQHVELLAQYFADAGEIEWMVDMQVMLDEPLSDVANELYEPTCCGEIECDRKNGCHVCSRCGRIVDGKVIVYEEPTFSRSAYSNQNAGPVGYNSGQHMTMTRKRFYKPLTHFKEHLRRYMGARFTVLPDDLIENVAAYAIDVESENAYFAVKAVLKKLRMVRYYKETFTILYKLGGTKPTVDDYIYHKCIADFQALMYQFFRQRTNWERHSMPSMYMLLDLLLRRNGHVPKYQIPMLKNEKLREQVMSMYGNMCTTDMAEMEEKCRLISIVDT